MSKLSKRLPDDNEKPQPLAGENSWSKNLIILQRCKDPVEAELEDLNSEAVKLAATIKKNLEVGV